MAIQRLGLRKSLMQSMMGHTAPWCLGGSGRETEIVSPRQVWTTEGLMRKRDIGVKGKERAEQSKLKVQHRKA